MWEFLSHRVDAGMARRPQCVIPVGKDGWRDQWGGREEDRDLRRAHRQCPSYYRMTSSYQSPGNGEVTGARDVGGGQLRMSQKKDKLWRNCWALIKHWWYTDSKEDTNTGWTKYWTCLTLYKSSRRALVILWTTELHIYACFSIFRLFQSHCTDQLCF